MTSRKKIASNRRNAKKSTGPKTKRGKSLVRFNALSNGLFATQDLLPGENRDAYETILNDLYTQFKPVNALETFFINQITRDMWRVHRIDSAECRYLQSDGWKPADQSGDSRLRRELENAGKTLNEKITKKIAQLKRLHGADKEAKRQIDALMYLKNSLDARDKDKMKGKESESGEASFESAKTKSAEHILDAILSSYKPSPMESFSHQRRAAIRDLLRNITALETLQRQRQTIDDEDDRSSAAR